MSLHWDAFADLEMLRRDLDRVFNNIRPVSAQQRQGAFLPGLASRRYPLINLYEDAEAFHLEALAPGLDPASLEVTVRGKNLEVAGEKKPLGAVPRQAYHRSERATGRFVRTVQLESEIDENRVAAQYDGGILKVTLPKDEKAKPKQISVEIC